MRRTHTLTCPTCESPEPRLHPATQAEGEVMEICPDPFHESARRTPGRHRNTNDLWSASPTEWLRDAWAVAWRALTGTPAPRTVEAHTTIPTPRNPS